MSVCRPLSRRHAVSVALLTQHFAALALQGAAVIWVQNPVRLGRRTEPQPDLALLHPPANSYLSSHSGPKDIFLLAEVAATTAEPDRG